MIDNIKRFLAYSLHASEIIKADYGGPLNIKGFDDFLEELNMLTDVDMDDAYTIASKANCWIQHFNEISLLVDVCIDKYKNVDECYDYIQNSLKLNIIPYELLDMCKIKGSSTGNILMSVIQKEKINKEKIKHLKLFNKMLLSYIEYLTAVYYKANTLAKNTVQRYKNTID